VAVAVRGILDARLGVGLVLLAGLGLLLAAPRSHGTPRADRVPDLPVRVGAFAGTPTAPEDVLPDDPRALTAARGTYTDGTRTVWVSVARYAGRNHPLTRPAVHRIAPEQGAVSIARSRLAYRTAHRSDAITVNLVTLRQPHRELALAYWYRIDTDRVVGEYDLRWRLFRDTLLRREPQVWLVRLATTDADALPSILEAFHPVLNVEIR
jgi:hypothetical protein